MWKWHPATRWAFYGIVVLSWYLILGPTLFSSQPWARVDPVRPLLILEALEWTPSTLLWLGGLWGLIQDVFLGLPVGFMGIIYATEIILLLLLKYWLNFKSLSGLTLTVLMLQGLQTVLMYAIAWIFSMALFVGSWWVPDTIVSIVIVYTMAQWTERSHLEYVSRTSESVSTHR